MHTIGCCSLDWSKTLPFFSGDRFRPFSIVLEVHLGCFSHCEAHRDPPSQVFFFAIYYFDRSKKSSGCKLNDDIVGKQVGKQVVHEVYKVQAPHFTQSVTSQQPFPAPLDLGLSPRPTEHRSQPARPFD